jgi:two-component system sensor histidine kinase/response regulator
MMAGKGNILVIDDELGIREGCRRVLEANGYWVETANDVQNGLQRIQSHDYDLVLLDVMMPDGRGIDLLAPMAQKDPDMVPIIITGYATVEMAVEATKAGAYDFISKPFTSDVLLMTVEQGLEKRRLSQEARRLQNIEKEAAELAKAKAEMERLDRYKTSFMLTVAHELRSPVGGAQSLVRTVMRGLAGEINPQQRDMLSRVDKRMDGLLELINDLLSLAASKTFDAEAPLEILSVQAVIKQLVEQYTVQAEEKNIKLVFLTPDQDLDVRASEDGLQKIFGNLIGNAIKYTPSGGSVHVNVNSTSKHAIVSVADTGIGIPQTALESLGEEFFRAPNARHARIEGTGLGLSIVKQFADHFGGRMDVQSEEGKGSIFTIRLPLASQTLS